MGSAVFHRSPASRAVGAGPRFHHVTAIARQPLETAGEIAALFDDAAAALPAEAAVLHWKVFAAAALDQPVQHPMTVVLNEPCIGGRVAGIQLLAVESDAPPSPVFDGDRLAGQLLDVGGSRVLCLADVCASRDPAIEPVRRMAHMFERAGELVRQCGFTFQQVARTWIYVDRLLDSYADLNEARDAFFHHEGIGTPSAASPPPASTGIQGSHPSGAASFMDLIAVSGAGAGRPMRTSHQCEAYDYGSAFSRGMSVKIDGHRLLYASGTASIDTAGETVHPGDPHGQIRETYSAVDTLLRHQGASLADSVTGVLFFKDPPSYHAWNELREQGALPELPAISVYADVCRPELLFELEVTAVQTGAPPRPVP